MGHFGTHSASEQHKVQQVLCFTFCPLIAFRVHTNPGPIIATCHHRGWYPCSGSRSQCLPTRLALSAPITTCIFPRSRTSGGPRSSWLPLVESALRYTSLWLDAGPCPVPWWGHRGTANLCPLCRWYPNTLQQTPAHKWSAPRGVRENKLETELGAEPAPMTTPSPIYLYPLNFVLQRK